MNTYQSKKNVHVSLWKHMLILIWPYVLTAEKYTPLSYRLAENHIYA